MEIEESTIYRFYFYHLLPEWRKTIWMLLWFNGFSTSRSSIYHYISLQARKMAFYSLFKTAWTSAHVKALRRISSMGRNSADRARHCIAPYKRCRPSYFKDPLNYSSWPNRQSKPSRRTRRRLRRRCSGRRRSCWRWPTSWRRSRVRSSRLRNKSRTCRWVD